MKAAILTTALLAAGVAQAQPASTSSGQAYPVKSIRLLVGFAPGGPSDVSARTIAQKLNEKWGQPVIVDFRPGAAGNIATEIAAKSPPDGYTLMSAAFAHAVNPSLYSRLPFNTEKDFAPILMFASVCNLLVAHPSLPVRSVKDLIALAKSRPDQLTVGSAGNGTSSHLSGELLKMMAGIKLTHIPYKGLAPAHVDTIGGQLSLLFDGIVTGVPAVKSGRLRALGVTSPNRWQGAPDIPAIGETVPGFDVRGWYGLLAPAGTPRDIIQRINAETARAIREPDARERLYTIGSEPLANTPEEFGAFIRNEMVKWAKVVKAVGIRIE
jgi:tripartite-type tricarboxylate transporter receptor subunit TctC